jgi:hypothetical protein
MEHDTYWGDRIPTHEVINPIVFQFQPTRYIRVSDEHRSDFEDYFRENIGFAPPSMNERSATMRAAWPNGGISGSNGGWDD